MKLNEIIVCCCKIRKMMSKTKKNQIEKKRKIEKKKENQKSYIPLDPKLDP